jgi:hypothetical protein
VLQKTLWLVICSDNVFLYSFARAGFSKVWLCEIELLACGFSKVWLCEIACEGVLTRHTIAGDYRFIRLLTFTTTTRVQVEREARLNITQMQIEQVLNGDDVTNISITSYGDDGGEGDASFAAAATNLSANDPARLVEQCTVLAF